MYQTETRRTPSLAFMKASASSWVMGGSSLAVTSMQRMPFWRVRLLSVIWPRWDYTSASKRASSSSLSVISTTIS